MIENTLIFFLLPLLAFGGVASLIPLVRQLAINIGFIDEPGGRKDHEEPVPPIGGLVLFPIFMLVAVFTGTDLQAFWPLYAALSLILITGALDDYRHINAWVKFSMQFIVAAIIVLPGHAQIYQLGDLFGFGPVGLDFMSIPFSIIAVVLFINAMNLMDGLDGLAGGKGFVVLFWLMLACIITGDYGPLISMSPLAGALLGFLYYNMRHPLRDKATVFLGDAGSMGLGLVLAWFAIALAQEPDPILVPISIAWIIGLPVIDACGQFFRRVREGRHPFSPDRGHFHHHFIHAGLPIGHSTAIILLIGFIMGGIGYGGIMVGVPEWFLAALWALLLLSHMTFSLKPQTYVDFFSQFTDDQDTK